MSFHSRTIIDDPNVPPSADEERGRAALGLRWLWASPYSAFAFVIGMLGILSGGRGRRVGHALEFYGGFTQWCIAHLPTGPTTLAITLGHVILGQTDASLDIARRHEWVHVRQYERWGPLFGPAYFGASVWLWLRGRDHYRENPFEREAYRLEDI
ncbi:MAG: hypothetical protein QM811_24685 [Pirellulales bacterium]